MCEKKFHTSSLGFKAYAYAYPDHYDALVIENDTIQNHFF